MIEERVLMANTLFYFLLKNKLWKIIFYERIIYYKNN